MNPRITLLQLENLALKFEKNKSTGCWDWVASKTNAGYGTVEINHKQNSAHKWIYYVCTGIWPTRNFHLDHLCRNRTCVNPKHLELVTIRTNILRGEGIAANNLRKTHCKHGHEFTLENTYHRRRPNSWPERDCKTCRRERNVRFNKKERVIVSEN